MRDYNTRRLPLVSSCRSRYARVTMKRTPACVNALPVLELAREISPLYAPASTLLPLLPWLVSLLKYHLVFYVMRARVIQLVLVQDRSGTWGITSTVSSRVLQFRDNSRFDTHTHTYTARVRCSRPRPESEFENGIRHRSTARPVYTIARKLRQLCRGVATVK